MAGCTVTPGWKILWQHRGICSRQKVCCVKGMHYAQSGMKWPRLALGQGDTLPPGHAALIQVHCGQYGSDILCRSGIKLPTPMPCCRKHLFGLFDSTYQGGTESQCKNRCLYCCSIYWPQILEERKSPSDSLHNPASKTQSCTSSTSACCVIGRSRTCPPPSPSLYDVKPLVCGMV